MVEIQHGESVNMYKNINRKIASKNLQILLHTHAGFSPYSGNQLTRLNTVSTMSLLDTSPTSTSPVSTANFILMPRIGTPGFKGCSALPPSAPFLPFPAPPPPSSPVGWTTCLPSLAMASSPQATASSASSTRSPLWSAGKVSGSALLPSLGLRLPKKETSSGGRRQAGGEDPEWGSFLGRRRPSQCCPRAGTGSPEGQPEVCFRPRSVRRCPQPARPGPCPAPGGSRPSSPRGSAPGPAVLRAPTSRV